MGKRGPKRDDTQALIDRGSPLGTARAKAARKRSRRGPRKRIEPKPIGDLKEIIKTLPGYDPYRDAAGCWFDEELARSAILFFHEELVHVKGPKAGQPFELEIWQQAFIGNLFGWQRTGGDCPLCGHENGVDDETCSKCDIELLRRRYRHSFVYVPRKNGKTPLAAGIILFMLDQDPELGAEIYGAAAEHGQARLVFDHASGMVLANERLRGEYKVFGASAGAQNNAIQRDDGSGDRSTYRVLSSEAFSKHGFNTLCYVVDELHAMKDAELTDALETSTGARFQPIELWITTADYEREDSVCNEKHDYACKVRDGYPDSSFLPVVFEAAPTDDWRDPATWAKANPNLGVSVTMEYVKAACAKAEHLPRFENTFKRLHLNIRTSQAVRWLPMSKWDECPVRCTDASLLGKSCYGALDLSASSDITVFALLFKIEEAWKVLPFFWLPEEVIAERRTPNYELYQAWQRQGLLRTTPGDMIDYHFIRREINEIGKGYSIQKIAVDRLFQGAQLANELKEQDGFEVEAFGQGFFSMAAPTLEFERLVLAGKLDHGKHPIMRWMAENVAVKLDDAGNMKASKSKSKGKIDGIVCSIMALGIAMVAEEPKTSVYETRGFAQL